MDVKRLWVCAVSTIPRSARRLRGLVRKDQLFCVEMMKQLLKNIEGEMYLDPQVLL